jgi:hypothetical protein
MDEMMKSLAARGAEIRRDAIAREMDTLVAAFPDLAPTVALGNPVAQPDTATHWTQTPAGRAQQSAAMKKAWKRRRAAAAARAK